ncbi:hypothetical protein Emed_006227 [Eimeria media]
MASEQEAAESAAFSEENVNPEQQPQDEGEEDTQQLESLHAAQPTVQEAANVLAPDSAAVTTPLRVPVARYSFVSASDKKKKKHKKNKEVHPLLKELKKKYKRQKKIYLRSHTLQQFFQLKYQTLAEAMAHNKS